MLISKVWVCFLLCGLGQAQRRVAVTKLEPLMPGVTLPVGLGRSLEAGKVAVGKKLALKTTQRIPVGSGLYMDGAVLEGEVVTSVAGGGRAPSVLAIRFTALHYRGQVVPVTMRAIAIANMMDVTETLLPANGSTDRGNSDPANWTTRQVGGDEVYRSGWSGDVCDQQMRKVGSADYFGVYGLGEVPRAVGVFSTTSAGLYGMDAGAALRSDAGTITVTEPGKKLVLRSGDNLLLEVQ